LYKDRDEHLRRATDLQLAISALEGRQ